MTHITRHHVPTTDYASGFIAPIIRASAHLGYAAHQTETSTEDDWEDERTNILADLT